VDIGLYQYFAENVIPPPLAQFEMILGPRTGFRRFDFRYSNLVAEADNFGSALQGIPLSGPEFKTIFWYVNLSKISSCTQGISMPNLVQIGESVLLL
jgi:hypothetical protein